MDGINKFMTHEALNANAYGEVNLEPFDPTTIEIFGSQVSFSQASSYITPANPAKKIILKMKAGHASSNYEDTDYIKIVLNGETEKDIKIDNTDLPFTIEGLMITQFKFWLYYGYQPGVDDTRDYLQLISYH